MDSKALYELLSNDNTELASRLHINLMAGKFDGSEYITLIINGVEYSGTTTVTQGTITATIAQGSNDITIDMGTGDVLPDIRVQFREEV